MPPNRGYGGGKRQREAERDRRKKEKQERLRRNRATRGSEDPSDLAEPELLPEVKLEDVVIGVAAQPRRNTIGPVKLFVGGLSWNTTSDELRGAFAKFGPIQEATVIMDRTTGRSRGFGFVSFENAADAAEAVKTMNGADLDGRQLKVNNAESR